jgi:hypothetical protein
VLIGLVTLGVDVKDQEDEDDDEVLVFTTAARILLLEGLATKTLPSEDNAIPIATAPPAKSFQ